LEHTSLKINLSFLLISQLSYRHDANSHKNYSKNKTEQENSSLRDETLKEKLRQRRQTILPELSGRIPS